MFTAGTSPAKVNLQPLSFAIFIISTDGLLLTLSISKAMFFCFARSNSSASAVVLSVHPLSDQIFILFPLSNACAVFTTRQDNVFIDFICAKLFQTYTFGRKEKNMIPIKEELPASITVGDNKTSFESF